MTEAYSVGIKLKLTDLVTANLIGVGSEFRKLNLNIRTTEEGLANIEKRLASLKKWMLGGGIMLGAGLAGLEMFKAPLDAARDYELAFTKFKGLNLGDTINKQADQFARAAHVMGVSGKELMTTMSETVGFTSGNFELTKQLAPTIAALNQANTAIYRGRIEGIDEGAGRALMQFIDRRGAMGDATKTKAAMDLAEKLVTGSGGFIQFRDLAAFSNMGGTAFRGLSDQGVLDYAYLISEQGGARAGTAMMSIYQNLVAGRTTKRAMAELESYGIGKIKTVETGSIGGKTIRSNILTDLPQADLLASDGPAWFRTVLLPLLAKKGVTKEKDILRITNDLLSNRNASGQGTIMDTQTLQLMRDAKLTKNAMGVDQIVAAWKKDPNAAFSDLTARWTDTLRDLGEVVLPKVVEGTKSLDKALTHLDGIMKAHPTLTTGAVGGLAGMVALATLGGSLMLITGGFKALSFILGTGKLATGLTGVSTAVTAAEGAGAATGIAGLVARLGTLGGAATTLLPILGTVAAALGAGYLFGKVLNSMGPDGDLSAWLGGKLQAFDASNNQDAAGNWKSGYARGRAPTVRGSTQGHADFTPNAALVRTQGNRSVFNFTIQNKINKRDLATMVFDEHGRAINGPQIGPSDFDARRALVPAGSGN